MADLATDQEAQLRLVEPGGGDHWWLLGHLASIKVRPEETGGAMTIAEFELAPGYEVPPHAHREEHELFYVLEGQVTFWCDGTERTFGEGGLAWIPKRKPHSFSASESGPARLFNIHAGPRFMGLLNALGERADGPRLPDPAEPQVPPERLRDVFDQHGIDLLIPEAN